jgi:hypothetical protein
MRSRDQFISYQQMNVLSSSPSKTPSHTSATRTKMMMPPYILDQWYTYGVSKGLAQWTMNSHQLVNFLVQVSLSLLISKEGKIKVSSSKNYATTLFEGIPLYICVGRLLVFLTSLRTKLSSLA